MKTRTWALGSCGIAIAALLASQPRLPGLFDRGTEAQPLASVGSSAPEHASRDVEASLRPLTEKNELHGLPARPGVAGTKADAWSFPRGMDSFIDEVMVARDASGAYKAAVALRTCQFLAMEMDSTQRAMSSTPDLKTRHAYLEKYQAMQARASQCQTVDGEMAEKQLALLALAVEGGVPGAAAAQLALDPRLTSIVAERLSADAQLGDIESITQLIWRSPEELGIAPDLHQAITQALQKARHDERVAVLANSYMDVAISWASVRQSKNPKNSSALVASLTNPVSPSTEAKAQQIFQAIKARYGS